MQAGEGKGPPGPAASALVAGAEFGGYRVLRPMGAGARGAVYEAVHIGIGRPVALELVAIERPAEIDRFLAASEAVARVDHPHVARVTDVGIVDGVAFVAGELLRGDTLGDLLSHAPVGLLSADVADILLAACAGVFAVHEVGVVHGCLGVRSIVLSRVPGGELQPKIRDFGTGSGDVKTDARDDVVALGAVLHQALTGKALGAGGDVVPGDLGDLVKAALAGRSATGLASPHALGRELIRFASPRRQVQWADYYGGDRAPIQVGPARVVNRVRPPTSRPRQRGQD